MSRYDAWKLAEPDEYDPDAGGDGPDPDMLRDERLLWASELLFVPPERRSAALNQKQPPQA